jgi:signal transduction histidine kinase
VSDREVNVRLTFLNRLFGAPGGWADVHAMLAELCDVFGLRAAGLRWPAEGPAILSTETERPLTKASWRMQFAVPGLTGGLFWADGVDESNESFVHLVGNAIGGSPMLKQALGPIAEQVRIAQRLDDAARVAGRVAHDLDNVFQGVTGFASLALDVLPSGSPAVPNIREVETSAKQGLRFCAQLHQLSRAGCARPMPSSIAGALGREVTRLQTAFPAIRFEVDAAHNLPAVAVEGGGLQAMLGHMLDNAAEASAKGALVKASAQLVELAPSDLAAFLGCPATGPHVEVKITDSGSGLTDEAKKRMFVEPFYTTKFRHRGLSLAVVYRMIYAHRGGVQADGQPGKGTTIRVVLPLAAARVPALEPGRSSGGYIK